MKEHFDAAIANLKLLARDLEVARKMDAAFNVASCLSEIERLKREIVQ